MVMFCSLDLIGQRDAHFRLEFAQSLQCHMILQIRILKKCIMETTKKKKLSTMVFNIDNLFLVTL